MPDFSDDIPGPCVKVTIIFAAAPRDALWHPRYRDGEFEIEDHRAGEWLRVRYLEGPTFDLKRDGSAVRAWSKPGSTLDEVASCVLGPISAILLYLRGTTCLHASAVAHEGRALVFVGAAEAGKSTLAAAFARISNRVLTDDVLALDERESDVFARPGIPRIGLWPDSVRELWGDAEALPRQMETWDKRYFDLVNEDLFQTAALPIGAVYVLAERESKAPMRFEPLEGVDSVLALVGNKYVTRVSEREQNRRDFVLLSRLASCVPIRRIARSDALIDLNATRDAILADYSTVVSVPV